MSKSVFCHPRLLEHHVQKVYVDIIHIYIYSLIHSCVGLFYNQSLRQAVQFGGKSESPKAKPERARYEAGLGVSVNLKNPRHNSPNLEP